MSTPATPGGRPPEQGPRAQPPAPGPQPQAAPERPASPPAGRTDATALVGRVGSGDSPGRRVWRTIARMMSSTQASRELAELAAGSQIPVSTDRLAEATVVEVTRLAGHLLARARQL